jgi:hypothetical protein
MTNDQLLKKKTAEQLKQWWMYADALAWWWAFMNQINLGHGPFQRNGFEFQQEILNGNYPEDAGPELFGTPIKRMCAKKATQMSFSESNILRNIFKLINGKYPKGVMVLFPTEDDVSEFSKSRYGPIFEHNPQTIGKFIGSTDSTNVKKIGRSFLFMHGTRATIKIGGLVKESSKLRSRAVDRIEADEIDLMDQDMIQLSLNRLSGSDIQEEGYTSSPTIPGYGIDRLYGESDQRVWMIKCQHCGEETCAELEFPNCIQEVSKYHAVKVCRKCKEEIFTKDGQWRPRRPDKTRELVGYWISQLNSSKVDPLKVLKLYNDPPNGNKTLVMNSHLGMAHISAENQLTPEDVWDILGRDPMIGKHDGPTACGVDVGNGLHTVIVERPREGTMKVVKIANLSSFNDLHDMAAMFHVKCMVIDFRPERHKVREFRKGETFEIYGCDYLDKGGRGAVDWDSREGIVRVNRTEICDATHDIVITPGKLQLPRRCSEIDEFVQHLCNIAKVLDEDEETGSKTYRYRKLGHDRPDHYRHALNYAFLAAQRIGIYVPKHPVKKIGTDAWDDEGGRQAGSWMGV